MNWEELEKHWDHFAGSARAHWSKLTDDDGQRLTGSKQELVERLEQRYGISSTEAARQVDEWSRAQPDVSKVRGRSQ